MFNRFFNLIVLITYVHCVPVTLNGTYSIYQKYDPANYTQIILDSSLNKLGNIFDVSFFYQYFTVNDILTIIGGLPNLRVLQLANSHIDCIVDIGKFDTMTSLLYVNLAHNNIRQVKYTYSTNIDGTYRLSKIRRLDLSHNDIDTLGTLISRFNYMPDLTEIDLSYNKITNIQGITTSLLTHQSIRRMWLDVNRLLKSQLEIEGAVFKSKNINFYRVFETCNAYRNIKYDNAMCCYNTVSDQSNDPIAISGIGSSCCASFVAIIEQKIDGYEYDLALISDTLDDLHEMGVCHLTTLEMNGVFKTSLEACCNSAQTYRNTEIQALQTKINDLYTLEANLQEAGYCDNLLPCPLLLELAEEEL